MVRHMVSKAGRSLGSTAGEHSARDALAEAQAGVAQAKTLRWYPSRGVGHVQRGLHVGSVQVQARLLVDTRVKAGAAQVCGFTLDIYCVGY